MPLQVNEDTDFDTDHRASRMSTHEKALKVDIVVSSKCFGSSTVHLPRKRWILGQQTLPAESRQWPCSVTWWVCIRNLMLECWLAWSCAGLVQATMAAVSSWVQQPCHVQKSLFQASLTSGYYSLLSLLLQWPLRLEGGIWYRCPVCGRELHCYLFSALWLVVSFCMNYHSQHQETSLMKS